MENLTAEKVLQETFKQLEQMLDEKNRKDRNSHDQFRADDPGTDIRAHDKRKRNEPTETREGRIKISDNSEQQKEGRLGIAKESDNSYLLPTGPACVP